MKDKSEYLKLYPFCPNCDHKIELHDITEDHDMVGAKFTFLHKGNTAIASSS